MNAAVVLAGGTGTRVGADIPKQFIKVMGKPIIAYALENLENNPVIDAIEIVCHKDWMNEAESICRVYGITKLRWLTNGGNTFQESVWNGIFRLKGILSREDIAVITFGVSPMTEPDIVTDSIRTAEKHGNGISSEDSFLCTCIKDDEYSTTQNLIRETIKGFSNPWAFRFGDLCDTYEEAQRRGILSSIEPHTTSVYLALGKRLWFSKSGGHNFKITTREDIERFEGLLMLKAKQKLLMSSVTERRKIMINYKEFEVINAMLKADRHIDDLASYVYSAVHYHTFKSHDEVSGLIYGLQKKGYINDNSVTESGMKEIEPLRVRNAIILSAGGGGGG